MALVLPETVPVKVGLARGALAVEALAIVVALLASLFNACANLLKVFSNAGAAPIGSAIFWLASVFYMRFRPLQAIKRFQLPVHLI
jgi:hypothetical protein